MYSEDFGVERDEAKGKYYYELEKNAPPIACLRK